MALLWSVGLDVNCVIIIIIIMNNYLYSALKTRVLQGRCTYYSDNKTRKPENKIRDNC